MKPAELTLLQQLKSSGEDFVWDEQDVHSEEYVHFYFLASLTGEERVYDCTLYTLRLQHESEMMEVAEARAIEKFPAYKQLQDSGEVNAELEEQVGLFMAEVILELEEEEAVKVSEHVDEDWEHALGISLDVGLNVDRITPAIISQFIQRYRSQSLTLDDTLYSFTLAQE